MNNPGLWTAVAIVLAIWIGSRIERVIHRRRLERLSPEERQALLRDEWRET